jgi:hypothetical protein
MECVEDHILYDEEEFCFKEKDDYGHKFDDEERESVTKIFE